MNKAGWSRRQFFVTGSAAVVCACCTCRVARGAVAPAADAQPALVAACGIYCGACPALGASLKAGAKRSDIKCLGCWNPKHAPSYAPKCAVRKCAKLKKVQSCGQCKDYPCKLIPPLFNDKPKYGLREKNLNAVRDQGLEVWLADQKKRWTCGTCGKGFGYGDKQCPSCSGKILTDAEEFAAFKQKKT